MKLDAKTEKISAVNRGVRHPPALRSSRFGKDISTKNACEFVAQHIPYIVYLASKWTHTLDGKGDRDGRDRVRGPCVPIIRPYLWSK